jgi:hypothetical protein
VLTVRGAAERTVRGEDLAAALRRRPARARLHLDLSRLDARPAADGTLRLSLALPEDGEEAPRSAAVEVRLGPAPAPPRYFTVTLPGQPAAVRREFERPFPEAENGDTLSTWDPRGGPYGPGSMRVMSKRIGASMQGRHFWPELDLAVHPLLAWSCRAERGTRLDLFLRMGGAAAGVAYLNQGSGLANRLGEVPAVYDGAWHRRRFDLGRAVCARVPFAENTRAEALHLQEFGWPGTPDGNSYWLDSLHFFPFVQPGPDGSLEARLQVRDVYGASALRYVLLPWAEAAPDLTTEAAPAGVTEVALAENRATVRLADLGPGAHALHWAVRNPGGWAQAPAYGLPVDTQAPTVALVRPAAEERAAPERILVRLEDAGYGIRPGSLELRVGGRSFRAGGPGPVQYQPGQGTAVLPLVDLPRREAGAFADDGEVLAMELAAVDLPGNPVSRRWSWTMDYARDRQAPPAPRAWWAPRRGYVVPPATLQRAAEVVAWEKQETRVEVVQDEDRGGKVLQVQSRHHGRSGAVVLWEGRADLRHGLHLAFGYRVHGHYRANWRFHVGGAVYDARFLAGSSPGSTRFTKLQNTPRKGGWHDVRAELGAALRKALPEDAEPVLTRVELGTAEGTRNHPNHWLRLDEVALYSDRHLEAGVRVRWLPVRDPTGTLYTVAVDTVEATVPELGHRAELREEVLERFAPGSVAHVGVTDRAGNRAAAHVALPEVPAFGAPLPAAGGAVGAADGDEGGPGGEEP